MAPALNLRHEQRVYLREGHDGMVVQNVGESDKPVLASWCAPLTCCKTLHIIYLSESVFSPEKGG